VSGRDRRLARDDERARDRIRDPGASSPQADVQPRPRGASRIPPPPYRPETVRVERVIEPDTEQRASRRSARREVDVSHVEFGGLPAVTAQKLRRRLAEAAVAFEAERYPDADRLLASIDRLAPGVAEVHELRGLVYYRLGRWARAIGELERFGNLTGSVEQHPVWADCCRALGRWSQAEELWLELGQSSPSPELVEEGRIVHAGGLADRGRMSDAIRLLEKAPKPTRAPALHHLRRWYVLADLYERTGDVARARRLFGDLRTAEPDFADVAERLAALS
jgi:tetratricopeptide (TPR) repeat protein